MALTLDDGTDGNSRKTLSRRTFFETVLPDDMTARSVARSPALMQYGTGG